MANSSPYPVEVYAHIGDKLLHGTLTYEPLNGFNLQASALNTASLIEDRVIDLQGSNGRVYRLIGMSTRKWADGAPVAYHIDNCISSYTDLPDGPFQLTEWGYPFDDLYNHQDLSQANISYEADTEILKLETKQTLHFDIPSWGATGYFRMGFHRTWKHPGFLEVTPHGSIIVKYDHPVDISIVLEHERQLREVLDLITHRTHRSDFIWLRGPEGTYDCHRTDQFAGKNQKIPAHLAYDKRWLWPALGGMLNIWHSTPEQKKRPLYYLLNVIHHSPGLPIDLRFWTAMQALEAWHEVTTVINPATELCDKCGRVEAGATHKARLKHYSRFWSHKELTPPLILDDWFARMVNTRHDITHLSKHPDKILHGTDITTAMNDLFIVLRACLLEHFGFDQSIVQQFVKGAFEQTAKVTFTYP